jgi:hypothetical protein
MGTDAANSVSTYRPDVSSEAEYLHWVLSQPTHPDQLFTLNINGSQYSLNCEQASNVVLQYDNGQSVIRVPYQYAQPTPIEFAVTTIGMDKLIGSLKISQLAGFDFRGYTPATVAKILEGKGFTTDSLFKLQSIRELFSSLGLQYDEFLPYIELAMKYQILDEVMAYVQNNIGREIHYKYNEDERNDRSTRFITRKINKDDLLGGLLALCALAEFRSKIADISIIPLEEAMQMIPELRVLDIIEDVVEGNIKMVVDPNRIAAGTAAHYSLDDNSVYLQSGDLDLSHGMKQIGNATRFDQPVRIEALHELVHANQDKRKEKVKRIHQEAEAWGFAYLYELLLFGDEFDPMTETMQQNLQFFEKSIRAQLSALIPPALMDYTISKLKPTLYVLSARMWAKTIHAILAGQSSPSDVPGKLMAAAAEEYKSTEMIMGLFDILGAILAMPGYSRLRGGDDLKIEVATMGTGTVSRLDTDDTDDFISWFAATKKAALDIGYKYYQDYDPAKKQTLTLRDSLKQYIGALAIYITILRRSPENADHLKAAIDQLISMLAFYYSPARYEESSLGL